MGDNEMSLMLFVRAGLGFSSHEAIPYLSEQQLERLYNLACKQRVIGLMMDGLLALGIHSLKGTDTFLRLYGETSQIALKNEIQFRIVGEVFKLFASKQIPLIVMKGPVVAQEYPNPLRRTPGDIDLYFTPHNGKRAIAIVEKMQYAICEESARDISFLYGKNIIEIHPYVAHQALQEKYICDRRFQKWCEDQITNHYRTITVGGNDTEIRIPSIMMTIVYSFYHLWIHFVRSGIGHAFFGRRGRKRPEGA